MGLIEIIENSRGRSVAAKKRVALGVAGSVTGVIFIVWLSVLFPRDAGTKIAGPTALVPDAEAEKWGEMLTDIGDGYKSFQDDVSQMGDALSAAAALSASSTVEVSSTTDVTMYMPPGQEPAVYVSPQGATDTPPAEAPNGL